MKKKLLILGISVTFILSAVLIYNMKFGDVYEAEVVKAGTSDIQTTIDTTGVVQPVAQYSVMPEYSGLIEKVFVKEGQKIKKDQALLKIDSSLLENQLQQAKIEYQMKKNSIKQQNDVTVNQKAQSAVALAQSSGIQLDQFNNIIGDYGNILKGKNDSAEAFNQSQSNENDSEIKLIETKMQGLQKQIDKCTIHSIIDGQVLMCSAKEGEIAAAGTPLMILADMGNMEIKTSVNEDDISKVKVGMKAVITSDSMNEKVQGIVYSIKQLADRETNQQSTEASSEIIIRPVNKGFESVSGITVNVKIIINEKNKCCTLPIDVLQNINGSDYIYVLKNGKAVLRNVKTGIQNDSMIQIINGIHIGDYVIKSDNIKIKNGMNIKVKK